jgi:hypothetical protein
MPFGPPIQSRISIEGGLQATDFYIVRGTRGLV